MAYCNFRFELPVSGWEDQTVYSFKGPMVDGMDHYLQLAIDRKLGDLALNDYVTDRRELILTSLKDVKIVTDRRIVLERKLNGHELILKWSPDEKLIRYKRYFFFVHDQMGFTFNCDYTKESYPVLSKHMARIVATLLIDSEENQKRDNAW